MNELISRIAAHAGIDEDIAQKAVGIILSFLQQEGDSDKVGTLIQAIPGADELLAASDSDGSGLSSGLAGLMGGGGVMAAVGQLQGLGLGMGQIQSVTQETVNVAREHAGDDVVNEIIASIPGLSQFV